LYVAAAKLGNTKARDLWMEADIGRQELYRVLDELSRVGLIGKKISNPTEFIAQPLSRGAQILLKRKRQEIFGLEAEVKRLTDRKEPEKEAADESEFCILPRKYLLEGKGKYSYENAKSTIDFSASISRIIAAFTHNIDVYLGAVERGVSMRVITEKPDDIQYEQLKSAASPLFDKSNFEAKFSLPLVKVAISIIDDKEVYFDLNPKKTIFDDQLLWTNNDAMVAVAKNYFDTTWAFSIHN
jgi:sugar-specific transcriptional regulator TrmB